MNILILRNLFIIILFTLGQPSFAQSINDSSIENFLNENSVNLECFSVTRGI